MAAFGYTTLQEFVTVDYHEWISLVNCTFHSSYTVRDLTLSFLKLFTLCNVDHMAITWWCHQHYIKI